MKQLKYMVFALLFFGMANLYAQDTITMESAKPTINLAFQNIDQQRFVGAADVITADELTRSTHYKSNNALAGLASGLYVNKGAADPGFTWTTLKVRGLSRGGNSDAPLMVVDGIPNRSIDNIPMESIETITVLKDITAKMLYGSQAANGVILLTTKRGTRMGKKLSFSAESGIRTPTFRPEYLNAAAYAEKYNEAQMNDGYAPANVLYTPSDLDFYRDGSNPLHYPNEDYYNTFVKNSSDYQRLNTTLHGGDTKTKFFLNLEYVHESGLENVGQGHEFNQLNLVSNLDYQVTDIISASLDLNSRWGLHSNSIVNGATMFGAIATHRPNDYPFFVTADQTINTDSLAFNTKGNGNLYGNLTRGGYQSGKDFQTQTAMAINFDLNKYVPGLTSSVKVGFDTYNSIYKGKMLQYATYKLETNNSLTRIGEDQKTGNEQKFFDNFARNIAGYGVVKYQRSFDKHAILADASLSTRKFAFKSTVEYNEVQQDNTGVNAGLRLNYAYDDKYIFQLNSSYMGTDRLASGNRFKLFGAAGAAWIVSKEEFLMDSDAVNYLKLKGSFGVMGYDQSLGYYQYMNEYNSYGSYFFGTNNAVLNYGQRISQLGNQNLTFEESTELNLGVEAELFNKRVSVDANYFNELRSGMPVAAVSQFPGYASGAANIINYNSVSNQGVDISLNYTNSVGDFNYSLGGNFMYSKAVYEALDELVVYDHMSYVGRATDTYLGLVAEGLYADQAEIDAHGVASSYGKIRPGDIRYENYINNLEDNVIDQYDVQEIGHTFPRINYGVNLTMEYKGLELYVLGQGIADVDKMLNNSYFLNYGEGKYSSQVFESDYPSLTTDPAGGHSFIPSSYWMKNGAYFKIRTAELSYTIPSRISHFIKADKLRLFARGTDLLTFSSIKTVDPEDINAGVTKYPLFTTATIGLKITF